MALVIPKDFDYRKTAGEFLAWTLGTALSATLIWAIIHDGEFKKYDNIPKPFVTKHTENVIPIVSEVQSEIQVQELANRAWFIYPESEGLEGHTLLPIDSTWELTAKYARGEEIISLQRLGVPWEIIDDIVRNTRIARIDKTNGRDLSFAEIGKYGKSEIIDADFGLTTLAHEDGHNWVRINPSGLSEAIASWFQHYVNGTKPDKPEKFMGCGMVTGDFDYDTAYYDFEELSTWFGIRTGESLFSQLTETSYEWQNMPGNSDKEMPVQHFYDKMDAKYKIPLSEISKHFEEKDSFKCPPLALSGE